MASMKIDISEVANGAIEKIKQEGYMVQKWIPCSERMPDYNSRVIVYTETNSICIAQLMRNGAWMTDGWHNPNIYHVISWMPLPEHPESEVQKNGK